MSHFLSVFMLITAVVPTVCLGVAAWRLSDEKDAEALAKFRTNFMGGKTTPKR